jgi:formylglycine-generating enzyme required for sulfatase activity
MAAVSASAAHTRAPAGRPWFTWLLSGAAAGILVLILVAAFLLVAWRFVRPLILAQSLNLPSADGMVRVPGGVYLVGLDRPGGQYARPQQTAVSTFWIDQYEVMNSQYADFLADTGQAPPDGWTGGRPPAGQERHPVHGVSWEQAAAYCGWAHKRLPTEAEWEVAARGPQNLLYPWGEDEHALELPRDATYSIGSVPSNRSPFGAYDMAGNVWEWVGEPYAEVEAGQRVLRGGGYGFLKDMAYRLVGDPHVPTMIATAGIRCAAEEVRGGGNEVEAAPNLAAKVEGVLFQDHFFDPASGWPSGEQAGGRFGYHPAAFYHVEVNAPNDTVSVFRGLSFGDFTAEAEVLVDHTNTQDGDFRYGLALRRSGDNYYAFTVAPRSRTWHALKHSAQGWQTLAEGEHDDIRGIGEVDKLRVDAAGPDFTFYINDRAVTEVSDSDYTGGDAGFVVETFDETLAHIHYASLTIREVDAEGTSVVSQDDFTDPSSGWPSQDGDGRFYGYHPPDYYHVEVNRANDSAAVFHGPELADVRVESAVFVDHTDTQDGDFRYGLALRRSGDNYYAFTVSPRSQTWHALKHSAEGWAVLSEGSVEGLTGLSQADMLRVDALGSDFTFRINDQIVAEVSDADYAAGGVGFIVETFDETLAHVHYDALEIRAVR